MYKPDIITCHPRDVLYPWWIARMNKDRELFNRIVVVMTQNSRDVDYTDYLQKTIKRVTLVKDFKDDGRDWRNAAINEALRYTASGPILFLEQDFLVKDDFFEKLFEKGQTYRAVGFKEGNRLHPACLLTNRAVINKTSKDFSVDSDVGDHFVKFSAELMELGSWTTLQELGLPDWYHLAGLTQNFRLDSNFYHPKEFFTYLVCSGEIDQLEEWAEFAVKKLHQVGKYPLDEKIQSFFKGVA